MKNIENLAIAMALNYIAFFCFIIIFISSIFESYVWFWMFLLIGIILNIGKIIFDWKFIIGEYKGRKK